VLIKEATGPKTSGSHMKHTHSARRSPPWRGVAVVKLAEQELEAAIHAAIIPPTNMKVVIDLDASPVFTAPCGVLHVTRREVAHLKQKHTLFLCQPYSSFSKRAYKMWLTVNKAPC